MFKLGGYYPYLCEKNNQLQKIIQLTFYDNAQIYTSTIKIDFDLSEKSSKASLLRSSNDSIKIHVKCIQ